MKRARLSEARQSVESGLFKMHEVTGDRILSRVIWVCTITAAAVLVVSLGTCQIPTIINVKDFGARGDSFSDDAPRIQAAINALTRLGGGVLLVPKGTYLLNTFTQSDHPWFFYNLIAGSNIKIQGSSGAKFLQGAGGRSEAIPGATEVRNTVLVFGDQHYIMPAFQTPHLNGGYYNLGATTAGSSSIQFAKPPESLHFSIGDYIAVFSTTRGDVVPAETSQVVSVKNSRGTLGLKYPLARSFTGNPVVANVTALATVNTRIDSMIIEGTEPLAATGIFGMIVTNCQLISDTSIGRHNVTGVALNTIRDAQFLGNVFTYVGPTAPAFELPQRDSQDITFTGNTFKARSVGFGEYGAHWKFTANHFFLTPDTTTPAALAVGGFDVEFSSNDVHGGGSVPLFADYVGADDYASYTDHIRIVNNTIECQASNSNCLSLGSPSPVITHNTITSHGNEVGIKVEGPVRQNALIQGNSISIGTGLGIVLNTAFSDGSTVNGNTIKGRGPIGIYVPSGALTQPGGHTISNNSISGFATSIQIDMSKHPRSKIIAR